MKIGDKIYYEGQMYYVSGLYREWKFSNQQFECTDQIEVQDYDHCRIQLTRRHKKGSNSVNVPLLKIWKPMSNPPVKGYLNEDDLVPNPK